MRIGPEITTLVETCGRAEGRCFARHQGLSATQFENAGHWFWEFQRNGLPPTPGRSVGKAKAERRALDVLAKEGQVELTGGTRGAHAKPTLGGLLRVRALLDLPGLKPCLELLQTVAQSRTVEWCGRKLVPAWELVPSAGRWWTACRSDGAWKAWWDEFTKLEDTELLLEVMGWATPLTNHSAWLFLEVTSVGRGALDDPPEIDTTPFIEEAEKLTQEQGEKLHGALMQATLREAASAKETSPDKGNSALLRQLPASAWCN